MSATTGTPCVRRTSAGRYFAAVGGRERRRYGPLRDSLEAAVADVEALRCGRILTCSNPRASDTAWATCSPAVRAATLRQMAERFRLQLPALQAAAARARRGERHEALTELQAAQHAIAEALAWASSLAATNLPPPCSRSPFLEIDR